LFKIYYFSSITSSTAPKLTGNLNGLPEDIFSYSHEKFYDCVEKTYGTNLSELLSFQAIRNGANLLSASRDAPNIIPVKSRSWI
jgi:hypothetical protein